MGDTNQQGSNGEEVSFGPEEVARNPLDTVAAIINLALLAFYLITLLVFMLSHDRSGAPRMTSGLVISAAIFFLYMVISSVQLVRGRHSAEAVMLRALRMGARLMVLIIVTTLDLVWVVLLTVSLLPNSAPAVILLYLMTLGIGAGILRWYSSKTNTPFLEVLGAEALSRAVPDRAPESDTPATTPRQWK